MTRHPPPPPLAPAYIVFTVGSNLVTNGTQRCNLVNFHGQQQARAAAAPGTFVVLSLHTKNRRGVEQCAHRVAGHFVRQVRLRLLEAIIDRLEPSNFLPPFVQDAE